MLNKNLKFLVVLLILLGAAGFSAAEVQDTIAYKLAILHTRAGDPDALLMGQTVEPSRATISEFHWIMEGLLNRCINPETAIADTIVETWKYVGSQGYSTSLLETARELLKTARNRALFGEEKVNFRMTSAYWIKQFQIQTGSQSIHSK